MPIFEYTCQDCQHEFEALTRASMQPECPRCHSVSLAKRLSVFATASAGDGQAAQLEAAGPAGACGACGHPGGPGACAWQQ